MSENENVNPYAEYDNMAVEDLGREMEKVRKKLDGLGEEKTKTQKRYDFITKNILPIKMEEAGMSSFKLKSGKGITVGDIMYVTSRKEQQPALFEWMRDRGNGDLVLETINSSSLKAFVKKCIKDGQEYPSELINVSTAQQCRFY